MKVFWCSNFSKMLPRCGRAAHICGANETALFPVTSRRQRKSFLIQQFFKNVGEVWASSPHLRSKRNLQSVFPAAIAFFEAVKFKQSWIMRIKAVSSGKATGQLQHAGRQMQGWNPLLPDAKELFSLREVVLRENNCVRFGRYASLSACVLFAGGCVVRIGYESFLDCSLQEFFMFLEWRTAFAYFS